ncbi:MAG: LPS-assembly protein LptD [Treponema sp.]|jgi:lipopolysaccharide assembly outer membrane protein LptD (OstA)|nr:LPS-assembly protein LptD [Treponema sp.]
MKKPALWIVFFLYASLAAAQTADPPTRAGEAGNPVESPEPAALEAEIPAESTEPAAAEIPPGSTEPAEAGTAGGEAAKGMTEADILERDIATSSLVELADWCRSLGLSEGGTKEELAARLRSHYRIESVPGGGESGGEMADGEASGETGENTVPAGEKTLVVTINSAKTTEYFTLETVNEEYVRLKGNVSLSLRDGDTTHTLNADEILYNRSRKLMSASGGVDYTKVEGDTTETFKGEGLTVNLDTWATVLMKGFSERYVSEEVGRYRFSGEVISASGEDSTVLKKAEISNADNEEAYWSIAASKLWLLPGSDWAVFNAVLKVGEIPVLYLPYFYYPADEIVFHPVFGYRSREGTFLQTTTYLMGRPKAQESSEESTITSIMGSGAGMEKKLEGVFLRSTGVKIKNENETRLSLLADAYTNLGFYIGSDLTIPPAGNFGETNFSGGIGISRDIAYNGADYTPFFPAYDGTSHWHSSDFFLTEVPLRYRFLGEGSVSGNGKAVSQASLSWSIPFYSDPYVNNDFLHRSEDSDIFTLLVSSTTPDTTINTTSLGAYEWKINGSLNFEMSPLSPYISGFQIPSASSSLSFDTRDTSVNVPESYLSYPPNKSFFYPKSLTLFSVSAAISGTPMTIGSSVPEKSGKAEEAGETEETGDYFSGLGNPVPPWGEKTEASRETPTEELRPPGISRDSEARVWGGQKLVLDYYLNPSAASELQFDSSQWKQQSDIDWDIASQLYTVRADTSLGLTLSENRGLYTTSLRFYGASSWQDYSFIELPEPEAENLRKQAHSINRVSSSGEYNLTLRPFYGSEIWSSTNFQYTLRGILTQTKYDRANDSWSWIKGEWNKDDIETHRVQANLNAQVMDKTQSLLISADLPPEESSVSGDATIRAWISETNARSRVREPFEDPFYEPVYLTETFRFHDRISLRQYAVYTPELSDWTILTTSLSLWDLTASFTATRSKNYVLEDGTDPLKSSGWHEQGGEESLNPQELRIVYNKSISSDQEKKISFGLRVDSGLTFDLQRYTYSKFTFGMGVNTKINNFLDATLSSYSENSEVYRYFFDHSDVDLPRKNLIEDLLDSFRFDDMNLRRRSGFKLKSFKLDLVHHLGDWDATLGIQLSPELDTAAKQYRFNTVVSFVIQWKPIKEFKTSIDYDKEGFRYK